MEVQVIIVEDVIALEAYGKLLGLDVRHVVEGRRSVLKSYRPEENLIRVNQIEIFIDSRLSIDGVYSAWVRNKEEAVRWLEAMAAPRSP